VVRLIYVWEPSFVECLQTANNYSVYDSIFFDPRGYSWKGFLTHSRYFCHFFTSLIINIYVEANTMKIRNAMLRIIEKHFCIIFRLLNVIKIFQILKISWLIFIIGYILYSMHASYMWQYMFQRFRFFSLKKKGGKREWYSLPALEVAEVTIWVARFALNHFKFAYFCSQPSSRFVHQVHYPL